VRSVRVVFSVVVVCRGFFLGRNETRRTRLT
jgi:hypothetical protein